MTMMKLWFVAILCSCALAADVFFSKDLDPAFHYTLSRSGLEADVKVITINGFSLYYILTVEGASTIVRCDILDKVGSCMSTDCQKQHVPLPLRYILRSSSSFPYDKGPEPVQCPENDSEQCLLFTNTDSTQFVIVDSQNRIVKYNERVYSKERDSGTENITITYHDGDVPTLDMFNFTKDCNGETLPAIASYGSFYPNGTGCSFHITVTTPDSIADINAFKQGEKLMYVKINYTDDSYFLARCDTGEYECYAEIMNDKCQTAYPKNPLLYVKDLLLNRFDYVGEPVSVPCSEGSTDMCTKYTDSLDNFILVDSQNRLFSMSEYYVPGPKKRDYETYYYLYHDPPSVEMFNDLKCINTTNVPPAVDTCIVDSSSSSSIKSSSVASKASSSVASKASSSPAKQSSSILLSSASLAHSMVCVVVLAMLMALL